MHLEAIAYSIVIGLSGIRVFDSFVSIAFSKEGGPFLGCFRLSLLCASIALACTPIFHLLIIALLYLEISAHNVFQKYEEIVHPCPRLIFHVATVSEYLAYSFTVVLAENVL